jgi:CDP-glycerol glycerophosphotransferase (TagB/SpsB family)
MTEHFSECFRIKENQCFEGAYPRLMLHKDSQLLNQALKFGDYSQIEVTLGSFSRRWIYMPTWRDDDAFRLKRAIPNMQKLNQSLLLQNALLVIKAHPNEQIEKITATSNIRYWDDDLDIYPILPMFDGLITDYSSILYDFLALGKNQIILYNYDYSEYINNSRSFAYPYLENTTGLWIDNFKDLCELLGSVKTIIDDRASYMFSNLISSVKTNL